MTATPATPTETAAAATQSPGPPPGPVAGGIVQLEQVRKAYFKPDGSIMVEALRGIDMSVPQGQYTAIMGASGSGKSTMMNILGCLDRPTEGVYRLDGIEAQSMSDDEISRLRGEKIGFVFQAFNLIPQLTIEENVAVPLFYQGCPPAERLERAVESLGHVGLGDRIGHRPSELSGGQMQRVAIARALVTRPVILMADEPTGNLDSKTGTAVLEMFDTLHADGMTILMVTHDDSVAERCQRVVRLRDGLIESDGPGGRADA